MHATWDLLVDPCYLVDLCYQVNPCYLRSASWPMLSPARIRLSPYWHSSGPASSVKNNIFLYAIVLQRSSLQFKKVSMLMYGERKIYNWLSSKEVSPSCYYYFLYDLLLLATETGKSHHFLGQSSFTKQNSSLASNVNLNFKLKNIRRNQCGFSHFLHIEDFDGISRDNGTEKVLFSRDWQLFFWIMLTGERRVGTMHFIWWG